MHDGAEGIDVAFWRVAREFGGLPEGSAGGVVSGEVEGRVAEVGEDDVRISGVGVEAEEDVAGFDVAVADASAGGISAAGVEAAVEELEGGEELLVGLPDEEFG